jgi:hypothetical protein
MFRKNVKRKKKKVLVKIKINVLENVLGPMSAVLLWLRDDCHCLKYKEKRKMIKIKGGSERL